MRPVIETIDTIHQGFLTVCRVHLRVGDERITREVEHHGDGVAVLPYDPARRVALVIRQPRAPLMVKGEATLLLEPPAGLLEAGEDPGEAARREAMEEAGVALTALEPLGRSWTMAGISTERMHMFLAPYAAADRTGPGGGLAAEHEDITVEEMPLGELARLAEIGELPDMRLLLLVQTLRLRHPALFATGG